MSEKKVRIHELAKRYGMPGKDLAAKLRDFGFPQAKSHMSALDPFEMMRAEGLLAANGISTLAGDGVEDDSGLGGLKVKKKTKKKKAPEAHRPVPVGEIQPAPVPAEPVAASPTPAILEAPVAPTAGAGSQATVTGTTGDGATAVAPQPSAPVSDGEQVGVEEAPATKAQEEPQIEGEQAATATTPETVGTAETVTAATAETASPVAAGSGPKGTVVGFIDLSTVQRAEPKRRTESRKLQSRDDFTPDVRPTYTHGDKGGRGGSGPRGSLTAAELREREQGRFLRRAGRFQPGGRGQRGGPGAPRSRTTTSSPLEGTSVAIEAPITIAKLAESLKLKANVVIKRAMQEKLGLFTQNTLLDDDTAALVAQEFDVELEVRHEITAEQAHLDEVMKKRSLVEDADLVPRSPIVAFLGHVDHGTTTLIDKIRKTSVAEHESGGITQHIGAYKVTSHKGHDVTIVDTPGHEAFTAMRARGANAVDVVVLVVAGDDGVMPSTEEAINHARAAKTPIVVALNKKDKPGFNSAQTIQQLMGFELIPEAFGGQTVIIETSGATGEGIDELLEHVHLMAEAELGLKAHATGPASGVVIEAEVQGGRGIVAHLLIQDGTLKQGDVILAGEGYGKVKSMHDDRGETIASAGPSTPVEVSGLAALPGVGDAFHVVEGLAKAKEIALEKEKINRAVALAQSRDPRRDLESILGSAPKRVVESINLIVRADVQGSAEVIRHEVDKLKHEEVEVNLIHSGVGPITESDVSLAATSNALLVAFHVGVNGKARQDADRAGLDIRRYDVIYELLDDLRNLMEGALSPEFKEEILGHVEIRQIFKSSRIGLIAGCLVLDGKITRNAKVRLMRDEAVVYTGELGSLKREKDDAKSVREGFECGIVLKDYRDIREGDVIEAYTLKEVKRTLEGGR